MQCLPTISGKPGSPEARSKAQDEKGFSSIEQMNRILGNQVYDYQQLELNASSHFLSLI